MIYELGGNLLLGILGGIAWCFVMAKGWEDTTSYEWTRRTVLGAIVGLIFFFTGVCAIDGANNTLLLVTASYAATDWFGALQKKRGA